MNQERRDINYIMAGGEGKRLHPLTDREKPKPILPIGTDQCIDFTLNASNKARLLSLVSGAYGFSQLEDYLKGENWHGILVRDSGIVGFGSLLEHLDILCKLKPENILVSPADHVHHLDYEDLLNFHIKKHAVSTVVAIKPTPDPNHNIWVQENGKVISYGIEPKGTARKLQTTGIFCFDGDFLIEALEKVPICRDKNFDITDIFQGLVEIGGAFAYLYPSHWRDIGTLDRFYEENIRTLTKGQGNVLVDKYFIADSSSVVNCVLLGDVSIDKNCNLKNSIINEGTEVPPGTKIGFDVIEDKERKIIVTSKKRRVVSTESRLKQLWPANR